MRRVAEGDDRTPDEVEASEAADAEALAVTANLALLFDLWTAEPFGVDGAREQVEFYSDDILNGRANATTEKLLPEVAHARAEHRFLHWPLAFPTVFGRDRPGFDAVIGNPPWEEVTVQELEFYARFAPGLRSLEQRARSRAVAELLADRPELEARLTAEQERVQVERSYFHSSGDYP